MTRIGDRVRRSVGDRRWEALRRAFDWAKRSYVVVIVVGIIVGLQLAPAVTDFATQPVSGEVAVIPLEGGIGGGNAASVASRLQQARSDPSVKAVVLTVNSGGGGAAASEEIYLAVRQTAEQMPVVVSVAGGALSGAYYSAVAADEIYVKPASLVGSVGVFFIAPSSLDPIEGIITTGPNKLTGADQREWFYKTESIKRAFIGAVMERRGDRLTLSRSEVAYAKIYTGGEAVDNGMADRIGGTGDAIRRAADLAGLTGYDVTTIGYTGSVAYITRMAYVSSSVEDKELISPSYFVGSPEETVAPNVVMMPPSAIKVALEDANATAVAPRIGAANSTEVSANGTA